MGILTEETKTKMKIIFEKLNDFFFFVRKRWTRLKQSNILKG